MVQGVFCSSFVFRWEKLHHVCVLMELSSEEGEIIDTEEKARELLLWYP